MKIIIFIFLLFLLGCKNNSKAGMGSDSENVISMNDSCISEDSLKKAVLLSGDTTAYYDLSNLYLDKKYQEEFLLYAIIMANKYRYPQAYFDVFNCIMNAFFTEISSIDEQSAKLGIEYLFKAADKGHHQAKELLGEKEKSEILDFRAFYIKLRKE